MEIFKVLGQRAPAATTLELLYKVPTGFNVRAQYIVICNRSSTAATYRIAIAPNGEADNPKHYLYWDKNLNGNDSKQDQVEISLTEGDEVRVYASSANLSFNLFGREIN